MDQTRHTLITLSLMTLTDPAGAARQLLAMPVPRPVLWQGFALVVVSSVLLSEFATLASPGAVGLEELFSLGPWGAALLQAGLLFVMVQATHRIGAAFGGAGSRDDALKVMVWLQAMLLAVQALQVVVLILLPGLVNILGLVATGWFFWVLTTFIAELHGFQSRGKVFAGVMLTFLASVLAMTFLLSALGVDFAAGGNP